MSVLEFDRPALWLNRLLALGLAGLFTALTLRLYPRRDTDASGLVWRLRPIPLMKSSLALLPFLVVPLVTGGLLWARIDSGFQGDGPKKLAKDYWRKNLATYLDVPLPDITAVDVNVALDPSNRRLKVEGAFDLVNNDDLALKQIPLSGGPHWESPEWTYDGKPVTPNNRSGLYVFTPDPPLPKGGKARIGFKFAGAFPSGITKNGGGSMEFIVPSGAVLTSFGSAFMPVIGFREEVGVDKENSYESKEYPDDYYSGLTRPSFGPLRPFTTRIQVSGPDYLQYNSVGTLTSETVTDGVRTSVWESDQPVKIFNIVAGRWDVRRGEGTAVYFHKTHAYNVDEMVEGLNAARKYYSEWFWPYPWRELKLSEFPALASYAQGFPTDITFSESIGFLTKSSPEDSVAFLVTAHESAHQWFGNIVSPGKGPGGNLVSEGTAHFATILLFEQVKGPLARAEFTRRIEDGYAKARSADSERPLVKIDGTRTGDTTVTYDKTGFVLWMLHNLMGRDKMLAGLRDFFKTYHDNPDHPVLQDLLASLRPHAPDAEAFDAFAKQWFFEVVIPEYQLSELKKTRDGDAWVVTAKLTNIGTGTTPVEVAATRGKPAGAGKDQAKANDTTATEFREARTTVTLGKGETVGLKIRCEFEPETLVVDPDVKVLMLRRKAATAGF